MNVSLMVYDDGPESHWPITNKMRKSNVLRVIWRLEEVTVHYNNAFKSAQCCMHDGPALHTLVHH